MYLFRDSLCLESLRALRFEHLALTGWSSLGVAGLDLALPKAAVVV